MTTEECGCFAKLNDLLKEHHVELLCNLFGHPRAIVSTWPLAPPKGKRRNKAPLVFASFCPFCGVKYPAIAAAESQP